MNSHYLLQELIKIMLEPNPKKRPTVKELLKHPWIARPEVVAGTVHRQSTIEELRKFNAKRKLKVIFELPLSLEIHST